MGQYYRPAIITKEGQLRSYSRLVADTDKEYTPAKIMEHSYLGNFICKCFSSLIYENPCRVAWVGDYAGDEEVMKRYPKLNSVWEDKNVEKEDKVNLLLPNNPLDIGELNLINLDKKCYLNIPNYVLQCSKNTSDREDWLIHPLPLLTAIGNGKGGGDYYGTNEEQVGCWAMDLIYFSSKIPEGFKPFYITFEEE